MWRAADVDLLVCYDVATEEPEGKRRLRHLAKACEGYGQRVQKSVFECSIGDADMARFRHRLLKIINTDEDSLRIYRLQGGRDQAVEVHGRDHYMDFSGALVI
ncbi:MAG: CRISPR-associated endonuclease Cas2 [Armatimonadetes bacterium]|nr:CRISPR-associated endonuclease Cas2 [Armatimonadota bacterium]